MNRNPRCDLTVLVLTMNEERHIARCLESVRDVASRIVVVDSGSTDATRRIAESLGAEVVFNTFVTHARQVNWALAHGAIATKWVMKLDADEYLTEELAGALEERLRHAADEVGGFTMNRRRIFMGKWLRHGALYPIQLLRIWRFGHGHCEDRLMDEHLIVRGPIEHIDADFADDNLNSITWWTDKHNAYASREAVELLLLGHSRGRNRRAAGGSAIGRQASAKRWIKENLYAGMPLGFRAMLYFLYRYFGRLGFLDGREGFVFHFFQGWWYRALVDVKVHEVEAAMQRGLTLEGAIEEVLGMKLADAGAP